MSNDLLDLYNAARLYVESASSCTAESTYYNPRVEEDEKRLRDLLATIGGRVCRARLSYGAYAGYLCCSIGPHEEHTITTGTPDGSYVVYRWMDPPKSRT